MIFNCQIIPASKYCFRNSSMTHLQVAVIHHDHWNHDDPGPSLARVCTGTGTAVPVLGNGKLEVQSWPADSSGHTTLPSQRSLQKALDEEEKLEHVLALLLVP
jgi:hypothetical protein